ncbi:carbon-monoxide dehydrogenase large subunit [Tamaricihabitans halophyticus]|uniref:Carbon-monoxide dehydrogenase large subunit n=1 Tax=Tamaricihabitans halophyticus TaxID=1262583 RepID=A0A4R2R2Q3_9PSEU|nr:xanthine dehydrogenase family protein molybdopterin-binding subunit [Tamaricihabitans halophyticus]TCP57040.1 carbon-monoxide dehydrogenase large subunit [Tamaricihabitans halophyticus]
MSGNAREPRLDTTGRWIGAALPRKEDGRMLRGAGRFVADLDRQGTLHACFVRSPFGAATIAGIDASEALRLPGVRQVCTAAELGSAGLCAALERDEFVPTTMPLLAADQVRYAGEPVAVVLADDPYAAEDGAEAVQVDYSPHPAVADLGAARDGRSVHDALAQNTFVDLTMFDDPRLDQIFDTAPLVLDEEFSSARLAALPMEGRGCLAEWDARDDQVVVHISTQVPHQVRSAIAQALRLPERTIRVIAPDVGGGFGLKCVVGREEVVAAALASRFRTPVKWIEDRQENLTASFHGHEQHYAVRAAFGSDGRILGLAADIRCDVGAYSAFPFTCAVEPLMATTELPGAYKVPAYRARGRAIATNKPPTAPYRGVSRPQLVLVMERLMEIAATRLALDPLEVRRRNLISPGEFPYTGVNDITYDEGSYRESLDRAESTARSAGWYTERDRLRAAGTPAGIGFACFSERTAYGTPTMSQRQMAMTPGYDTAQVRMDPTGEVIVTTGTCGHGQGHETTFAQIVAERLGIHPDQVRLRQGDTDLAAYGWGTFASRSIVIGGTSARRAADGVAAQLRRIAAHLLEADDSDVELNEGMARVRGVPGAVLPIAELANTAYFRAHELPQDTPPNLTASGYADPPSTFSNASHAALISVDPGTGAVRIHRYLVVEDCGVVINPLVVDGQVRGGVAQGIAAALYERLLYDADAQPGTASLMDYLAPTATEVCTVDIEHLQTPSQFNESGAKGMGEGGTIGAPATVLNAVNDALADTGSQLNDIPVLPEKVLTALRRERVPVGG